MPYIPDRVDASPTKAFFVRMLTRDITLEDCILDLIDNSIDGAWESTGARPSDALDDDALSGYVISIEFGPDKFSITDNCGGIGLTEAAEYAFTFGRKQSEPKSEYTVGVYGIGMKRAVFKLGKSIRIHSTYQSNGDQEGFLVPIEVDEWASSETEHWDFELEQSEPADQNGVRIEVTELSPETSQRFSDATYERDLRIILSRDYMLPLMRGLRITVNDSPVNSEQLRWQDAFPPQRVTYTDDSVTVAIIAGMHRSPPDEASPDDPRRPDRTSGWYIVCNGRAVLAADRTVLTGWGTRPTWPSYHNQYSGFLGFVLFTAADPADLPMTTTKRSVDVSSPVYRRALVEMEKPTRAWIDYTNARKTAREQAVALERKGNTVTITNVLPRERFEPPRLGVPQEPRANVNYSVLRRRMNKLAAAFGDVNLAYREVGVKAFDYAYDQLVDEDE